MKYVNIAKLSVLLLLGISSYVVSSRLSATSTGTASVPVQDSLVPSEGGGGVRPPGAIDVQPIARFRFAEFRVFPVESGAAIDVTAEIQDSREGQSYVWAAIVRDGDSEEYLTSEIFLETQFTSEFVADGEEQSFVKVVDLGPGAYQIELRLYDVTMDPDLEFLNLIEGDPNLIITSAKADVEIR